MLRRLLLASLSIVLCGALFAYKSYEGSGSIDDVMSPSDAKKTGVNKLTPQEKQALMEWVNRYSAGGTVAGGNGNYPSISEVLGGGNYVRLSDGTLWKINPADTPITQGWITPVGIIVSENTGDSIYPFKLTNSLTGSSVRAQAATSLPEYLIKTPQTPATPTPVPAAPKAAPKKAAPAASPVE